MSRARLIPCLGLLVLGTACTTSSSGAPPLKICGTTLYSGASGASVTDATGTQPVVAIPTGFDEVVLRFVDGCSRGAAFTIRPAGAGNVERVAYARDHHVVAAVLRMGRDSYEVLVHHPDGRSGLVRVIP